MTAGRSDSPPAAPSPTLSALVLGGSGFIGGHLLAALAAHPRYGHLQSAGDGEYSGRGGAGHVRGEIGPGLLAACSRPDVVFWLAGSASVAASIADPDTDFQRSLPPLDALLAVMAEQWRGSNLVFVSSAAVYGSAASAATGTGTTLRPISPYGEHKCLSEERIAAQAARTGLPFHIVRPFSVYGPGLRKQLFWDAAQKAAKGDFDFFGSGEELRDWVYVGDLADLLADVGARTADFPQVLNAGTGRGVSTRTVLTRLFEAMGLAQEPRFAHSVRPGDPDRLVADALEQRGQSAYHRTTLDVGVRRYAQWLREVGAA